MLRDVPGGGYRFLPGIEPYSSGAVALPGHAIVHVTLCAPVPWRDGFALIDRHLREKSRTRTALCAIALRIPKALSFVGFAEFNAGYREQLVAWGLLVDGANPIARTNVAPLVGAPLSPSLYAFAYAAPGATARTTFVVAGSGEVDRLNADTIVRRGETSAEAIREKAAFVMRVMHTRKGPLLINELASDKEFDWLSEHARQMMAVPLQRHDQVLGCLYALDKQDGDFDSADSVGVTQS